MLPTSFRSSPIEDHAVEKGEKWNDESGILDAKKSQNNFEPCIHQLIKHLCLVYIQHVAQKLTIMSSCDVSNVLEGCGLEAILSIFKGMRLLLS
jgi:hypothetical protein